MNVGTNGKCTEAGCYGDQLQTDRTYFAQVVLRKTGASEGRLPGLEESRQKTGVETDAADIWLYPNPTGGELTVDVQLEESESATVEVFNLVGQIVFSETLRANEINKIDLGQLTNGIYTARLVVDGNTKYTEKLSIVK